MLVHFDASMEEVKADLADLADLDAVVGIPFHDEDDTLAGVVRTARAGLKKQGLAGKAAVLCCGPERGRRVLGRVLKAVGEDEEIPVRGVLLGNGLDGRGWSVRALMVLASRSRAPLVLLPPNLVPAPEEDKTGFSPDWIGRLLAPIEEDYDLALARFNRHPLAHPVESLLASPVISGVFGFRLRQPTPRVAALSQRLNHSCLAAADLWASETGSYGFDAWLVTRALAWELSICEVPLGTASFRHEIGQLKPVFHQIVHAIMSETALHEKTWMERSAAVKTPHVSGPCRDSVPPAYDIDSAALRRRFKLEFNHFDETLFRAIVPDEFRERMERRADAGAAGIGLTAEEWIRTLTRFLLAYRFEPGFHPDDIVDGLFPFFLARLATFIDEYRDLEASLSSSTKLSAEAAERITRHESERKIEGHAELFVASWPEFRRSWKERDIEVSPYLPRLSAWQFVPNVEVIVPQAIEKAGGKQVMAYEVYKELIDRYRGEFKNFVSNELGIEDYTKSTEILQQIESFMYRLDRALDVDVYPFDITTVDGARRMAEQVCGSFANGTSFQLTADAARLILHQAPPGNLIMRFDAGELPGSLEEFDPRDALGLAAWTDQLEYPNRVLDIIEQDGESKWFEKAPLKPLVVDLRYLANTTEIGGSTALARLAGRAIAVNTERGAEGRFPKLWFFLKLVKRIVGIELFSDIWQGFAAGGFDFGERVVTSIRGHWGRRVLSAHNAFENWNQRIVVERIKKFADALAQSEPEKAKAARLLRAAADVYHLSITLPDTTFIPLSAWTWASFSNRGGVGAPTPLSSLVERDWATRDFVTAYLTRAELGNEATINKEIVRMIEQGEESESLRERLFGVEVDPDTLVVVQRSRKSYPPAKKLERALDRPFLEPIAEHDWESRYVLNAGAVRLDGTVYILYRAFGKDKISRIGLAWAKDGIHVDGRLDEPIFVPVDKPELGGGVEDPRVVVMDGRLIMLYTAYDGKVAQIAMASISVKDFLARRFNKWRRHGLGFPKLENKDAVLYPEKFSGKYVIYHRIDPSMWITYADDLSCPWPRTGHKIIVAPRSGMMWDGIKIGAGGQPIKTTHGWLNIYHGVDYERSYRLGVLFMPLDDPSRVIYRSPNPVLEPETDYELGDRDGRDFWVPHVVFTCGVVPAENKEIIGPDDDVLVYYGAADTVLGVARQTLRGLVPIIDSLEPA